jgi:transposase
MAVKVRTLTEEEAQELTRWARARPAPHRLVQRAQIIWASAHGATVPAIAHQAGLSAFRVRAWLRRFNQHGLAGLADAPRSGRPRRHDDNARGTVIALARTKPRSLGLPFALWTLARLQQALQERHGLWVTPATIWKWLQAEGLAWKRQQSWFHVRVDAAFTEKRGPSSRPTRGRSQSGGLSASTSSGR